MKRDWDMKVRTSKMKYANAIYINDKRRGRKEKGTHRTKKVER